MRQDMIIFMNAMQTLYIQLQFKSFYKTIPFKFFRGVDDKENISTKKTPDSDKISKHKSTVKYKNITASNLYVFFLLLLLLEHNSKLNRNLINTGVKQTNKQKQFILSFFFMPLKKKSIIFLRAPYKNKLARLNILNLEYTLIISLKCSTLSCNYTHSSNLLIRQLLQLGSNNLSTLKLKHTKTKININTTVTSNFNFVNFM